MPAEIELANREYKILQMSFVPVVSFCSGFQILRLQGIQLL